MSIEELVEQFQYMENWEDKYQFLIELGKSLPPLNEDEKIDANRVEGCMSQVWLLHNTVTNGNTPLLFRAQSDAILVNGLIAIVLRAVNNHTPSEILAMDIEAIFTTIGMLDNISSQRSNGLRSMIMHIKARAQELMPL